MEVGEEPRAPREQQPRSFPRWGRQVARVQAEQQRREPVMGVAEEAPQGRLAAILTAKLEGLEEAVGLVLGVEMEQPLRLLPDAEALGVAEEVVEGRLPSPEAPEEMDWLGQRVPAVKSLWNG